MLSLPLCRIVLMDDAVDYLMSFADFLYAFQLQFYYHGKVVVLLTCIPFAGNKYDLSIFRIPLSIFHFLFVGGAILMGLILNLCYGANIVHIMVFSRVIISILLLLTSKCVCLKI